MQCSTLERCNETVQLTTTASKRDKTTRRKQHTDSAITPSSYIDSINEGRIIIIAFHDPTIYRKDFVKKIKEKAFICLRRPVLSPIRCHLGDPFYCVAVNLMQPVINTRAVAVLDQQEMLMLREGREVPRLLVTNRRDGWGIFRFRETYEPRRLPFPAPEELDTKISKLDMEDQFAMTYTLILLATCAKPVSLSASLLALCKACFRSSILFLETSS